MIKEFNINNNKYFFSGENLRLYKDAVLEDGKIASVYSSEDGCLEKVTVVVSKSCNANCSYCYQRNKNNINIGLMSFETANLIIDELLQNYKKIKIISFFGGEPLLNFEIIRLFVERLKEKIKINKFSITTNLVKLDKTMIDFFINNNFEVVVSLDGPKNIHDKLRIGCDYNKIIKNLDIFKKLNFSKNIIINCTYTRYHQINIEYTELIKFFEKLGFNYLITDVISNKKEFKLQGLNKFQKIDYSISNILNDCKNITIDRHLKNILDAFYYNSYVPYFCTDIDNKYSLYFNFNGKKIFCELLSSNVTEYGNRLDTYNSKKNNICSKCWAKKICQRCVAYEIINNKFFDVPCENEEIYSYAMKKIINIYDNNPNIFQRLFDNYYDMN